MSRAYFTGVAVMLLSAVWFSTVPDTDGAEPADVARVSADDLASGKVVVIGRLGVPMQEMMTIRGTWQHPEQMVVKDNSLRFRVTHVDGKKLAKPIEFRNSLVRVSKPGDDGPITPADGDIWEFRGFETGRFRERPQQFYIEVGTGPVATMYGGFTTELEGFMPVPDKATLQRARKAAKKDEVTEQPDKSERSGQVNPKKP